MTLITIGQITVNTDQISQIHDAGDTMTIDLANGEVAMIMTAAHVAAVRTWISSNAMTIAPNPWNDSPPAGNGPDPSPPATP